ncbi:hypothetical protein P9112_001235 [Eukaryota sp. TZLM1-RC]
MCKSYRVDSFFEPLLSKLILDDPNIDSTRYNRASMGLTRGDLIVPGLNGSFTILDAMSIDPCNSSNEHLINSDVNNPLLAGEKYKIAKYAKPISSSTLSYFTFCQGVKVVLFLCQNDALADSDSDTDWNTQAKILPVRTSSSLSLNHSPHNASYARNSSQKNFHSKTDHCTRKNTQKPPLRSLRSVARSINNCVSRNLFSPAETGKSQKYISSFNSQIDKIERTEKMKPLPLKGSKKCLICGISGHNSRTCPEKQKREFELKSAQQILKCSVPAVAVVKGAENNVSDYQQLNASSAHSASPSENNNFSCPFCKKDVADSRNGRKLLFCTNCKAVDTGKAAGPSGISFDLLKIACSSAPEIPDDLAHYFPQLNVLKINPPFELLAARLIALVKPGNGIKPDGIRPIAVGESLSRLLASIVFDRVKDKASTFLNPHQFGIKTIDGASVAVIASDTFFNAEENNFIFNLDFKNAFNSVNREAIFEVIKSDFPELSSFFYHFYGKESDLIFNSFALKSSSGVKQGDPLGPLLFCLAIHKTLNIIKQKYPSIKIVAYMDDISLIGSFDLLELVAQEIADSYENIGLHLNASKCLLIGSSAQDLVINDSIVPLLIIVVMLLSSLVVG